MGRTCFSTITHNSCHPERSQGLMHSAGVGKMRRFFASLKMTGWMDAMDSGDPTPENIAQVRDHDPFFIFKSAATTCVCEGTTRPKPCTTGD